MDQREVWDNIAEDWNKKRVNAVPDTASFLANKKGTILDLGCGSGRNFTKTDGTIIGADFSAKMLKLAKEKTSKDNLDISLVLSDALNLPFADDSFDSIVLSSVLHCIKWNRRKKVLGELKRVAKNGAPVFVSVWNKDQPRFAGAKKEAYVGWTVKGKTFQRYYYLYSKDELEAAMKKYFSNVRVFGSSEMASGYPKNLVATGKVRK